MVKFRLDRFAALVLEKTLNVDDVKPMNFGSVSVEVHAFPHSSSKIALIATTYFDAEKLAGAWDDQLSIPRAAAEQAITTAADILAIATCGGRRIESCAPHFGISWPVGVMPDCGSDWTITKLPVSIESQGNKFIDISTLLNLGDDRSSGISLLSSALSNSNGLGRFVGFCRLFEDAFALSVSQVDNKLTQFLASNPVDLHYTRAEVKGWLSNRDGASHGDLSVATKHVMESDVLGFLPRMQQAAIDVLLNKNSWHSNSRERRGHGRPSIVFSGESPIHITATVGRPVDFQYKLVDPFCHWPIAGDCSMNLSGAAYPRLNAEFPTEMEIIEP